MLFKPIDIDSLLNHTTSPSDSSQNIIGHSAVQSNDYSKTDFADIDKTNNIICVCPDKTKQTNQIGIDNNNIVFRNNCNINLSTLINLVTPNSGAFKLLFNFKLIVPSEFTFDFNIQYPFISRVFKKYTSTPTDFGYTIYSNIDIVLYIDLVLLRQYKLPFEIIKHTNLLYLHIFPLTPIAKTYNDIYLLHNTELFKHDIKYL